MLFFIRGSVIFDLHKQVTNDTLGLEFFEIRYEDADNRRAYPCTWCQGDTFCAIRNVFHSYFEDYLVLSLWSLWMNSVSTPAYGLNGTRSASSTIASGL